jgi:hypothetical protein
MVYLGADQKAAWAVEVKWSDRYCDNPGELKSLLSFCHANSLNGPIVTSKTRSDTREIEGVRLEFVPASIYCYTVGYNLIQGKKALRTLLAETDALKQQYVAPGASSGDPPVQK